MKRFFALSIFICLFITNTFSQSKFGDVKMDEMTMNVCELDTTASAVVLLNKGETRFTYDQTNGFRFETSIQMKIKILKSDGLEYCNIIIPYYEFNRSYREQINDLSGTTYNLEDGKITKTKLSKDLIVDESEGNKKIKKFTMPAAKAGSVIEYKYTLVSDFYTNLRDFYFQNTIPTLYTSYEIKIPEYFNFNINTLGYYVIKPDSKIAYESFLIYYRDDNNNLRSESIRCNAKEHFFEATNLPAIKEEPYMWPINDYISKVVFEIKSSQMPYGKFNSYTTTWEAIDKKIIEDYYGNDLKKDGLFKKEFSELEITPENAATILNTIKSRVKWNEQNSFFTKDLKKALTEGIGNSADINFLLINALKSAGFNAFPVILSTRTNGRVPLTHPSIEAFNYVITGLQIDSLTYYTDASSKFSDWNILPLKCMVRDARRIGDRRSTWVNLTTISSGQELINGQMELTDEGSVWKISKVNRGMSAYALRNSYFAAKNKEDYIEKLSNSMSCHIEDFKTTDIEIPSSTCKMEYIAKQDDILTDEDYIYISPMVEKQFSENKFKSETRKYPVNFDYPVNYMQIVDIKIPEGFAVDALPQSEKIVLGDNEITLTYRIISDNSSVKLQYRFQQNKLLFLPNEYELLQDFFSKVVAKNTEQIVLKRITDSE